jgi:hypothetical protein
MNAEKQRRQRKKEGDWEGNERRRKVILETRPISLVFPLLSLLLRVHPPLPFLQPQRTAGSGVVFPEIGASPFSGNETQT